MFDAAGAVTNEAASHTDAPSPSESGADHAQPDTALIDALAQSVPAAAGTSPTEVGGRHDVMFVDPTIANYEQLVAGARAGVEVVVLDADRDGLAQMAEYLNGRSDIDSIQIMAHGSAGRFALGSIDVNSATLQSHAAELAAIGGALSADGDILIYACNTGAGIDGMGFIIELTTATGADVAASSDNTGSSTLGGNWTLETKAGTIESAIALTDQAQDDFDTLMTASITLLSGSASPVSAMTSITVITKIFIAADFDGDGDTDFIFRNNTASPTGVDFWRNSGGTFTRNSGATSGNPFSAITWSGPNSAVLAANFAPFSMLVDDIDGDGDIDIVNMASGNARGIWRQGSDGNFTREGGMTLPMVTANTQSVAGDFDGDGDIDLIIRNNTGAPTGVNFWRNDAGSFILVSSTATNNPFSAVTFAALAASFDARYMAAGDVDGDGDIDVINMTSAFGRGIWRNDNGVFSIVSGGSLPTGTTAGQFVAGDFDNDGDTDIAFRNASGTGIDFYRASGGTYTLDTVANPFSAIVFSTGASNNFNADLMAATDIDGDGDLDIVNFASTAGRGTFRNDLSPPQLTSVVVGGVTVDNTSDPTGANTTPTITLNFANAIQSAGAGKIYVREYGTDILVGSITANDTSKVTGVGTGSAITITPGLTLTGNTKYYIQIDKGAFYNSDGATLGRLDTRNNSVMGLTSKTLFDFTTGAAPPASTTTTTSTPPPPPVPTPVPMIGGNGPSSNTSTAADLPPSLPGAGTSFAGNAGDLSTGDAGRTLTLNSIGGDTSSDDAGRSVTLGNTGGNSANTDAGRTVTLSNVGGQGSNGDSSSLSGIGGTGTSGLNGGLESTQPGNDTSGNQGPPNQGQPTQDAPQDASPPTPTDGGDTGTPDGTPTPAGTGDSAVLTPPIERAAPGFARQVATAHGGPAGASTLIAALTNHVLPNSRVA